MIKYNTAIANHSYSPKVASIEITKMECNQQRDNIEIFYSIHQNGT